MEKSGVCAAGDRVFSNHSVLCHHVNYLAGNTVGLLLFKFKILIDSGMDNGGYLNGEYCSYGNRELAGHSVGHTDGAMFLFLPHVSSALKSGGTASNTSVENCSRSLPGIKFIGSASL
jgi:hypothetical protein